MHFTTLLISTLLSLTLAQQSPSAPPNDNYIGTTAASRSVVTRQQSSYIIAAAIAQAQNLSTPECIAVVDPSGLLVAFQRMDNAFPGTIEIAIKKAKTVANFNGAFPNQGLYNASQPGGFAYGIEETNGGLVVFGGGQPIFMGNKFIGAVGASGSLSIDVDVQIAIAGVEAVGSTSAS